MTDVCAFCRHRFVPPTRSVCEVCAKDRYEQRGPAAEAPAAEPAAVWAIVSLMGHKQYAGKLSEVERFGGKLGRIDVIDGDGFRTVEFGAGSIYGIEYVSEEAARIAARRAMPQPVQPWELPKQLAPAAANPRYRGDREADGLDNSDLDDSDLDDSDVEDL